MNKRIREFAEQAFIVTTDGNIGHANEYMIENFAELIIKECASMARVFQANEYDFTGDLDLDEFMLKHFGVEE